MSATDLAVNALRTFGDTQDGKTVDETFDLTGDSLEELQNVDLSKADNNLFNSLIDGKSADKRKLNGDGTILSVVQNVTTVWALQGGEYVPHLYVGITGTWADNLGGDVDANWVKCDNASLANKIESLYDIVSVDATPINSTGGYVYYTKIGYLLCVNVFDLKPADEDGYTSRFVFPYTIIRTLSGRAYYGGTAIESDARWSVSTDGNLRMIGNGTTSNQATFSFSFVAVIDPSSI